MSDEKDMAQQPEDEQPREPIDFLRQIEELINKREAEVGGDPLTGPREGERVPDDGAPGWSVHESGAADAERKAEPSPLPVTAILEPQRLAEFLGQPDAVRRMQVAIGAAQNRGRPIPHLLMAGPAGLGKTTLSHIVAREMGVSFKEVIGSAVRKADALADIMVTHVREPGTILFIDEMHRMPVRLQELLYSAMTHGVMDIPVKGGVDRIVVPPFTLVGATTEEGLLTAPMRRRFGMTVLFRYYTAGALALMVLAAAERLGCTMGPEVAGYLAGRSRGTPSHAYRLLQRADEMAAYHSTNEITPAIVMEAMDLEGVDDNGLNYQDWLYLTTLAGAFAGGPAGSGALSASTAISLSTIEDVVEPYLLELRLIARTGQGRVLTPYGRQMIRQRAKVAAGR